MMPDDDHKYFNTWEDQFRHLLLGKGYVNPEIHYDPMYGFTILPDRANYQVEFESMSPTRVRAWIAQLPEVSS